jgi:hypothetical protein
VGMLDLPNDVLGRILVEAGAWCGHCGAAPPAVACTWRDRGGRDVTCCGKPKSSCLDANKGCPDVTSAACVCHRLRDVLLGDQRNLAAAMARHRPMALPKAAKAGRSELCQLILDPAITGEAHRAKADAADSSEALRWAARYGHVGVCQVLLDPAITGEAHQAKKADAGDSQALQWAAENGHLAVCDLLMDPAVAGQRHYAKPSAHVLRCLL